MRIQITLKSGAQIEADVDGVKTARDPVTLELTKLEWETPGGWTAKLHTIKLDEVAAIVAVRSPSEAPS